MQLMPPRNHLDLLKAHLQVQMRTSQRYAHISLCVSSACAHVPCSIIGKKVACRLCQCQQITPTHLPTTDLPLPNLPLCVRSPPHLIPPLEHSCKHDQACGMSCPTKPAAPRSRCPPSLLRGRDARCAHLSRPRTASPLARKPSSTTSVDVYDPVCGLRPCPCVYCHWCSPRCAFVAGEILAIMGPSGSGCVDGVGMATWAPL